MVKGKKLKGTIEEAWGFEAILCVNIYMPCPSMGPKLFWTFQIILVEYQNNMDGPKSFWTYRSTSIELRKYMTKSILPKYR